MKRTNIAAAPVRHPLTPLAAFASQQVEVTEAVIFYEVRTRFKVIDRLRGNAILRRRAGRERVGGRERRPTRQPRATPPPSRTRNPISADEAFDAADRNGDGVVSLPPHSPTPPQYFTHLCRLQVDREEYAAYRRAQLRAQQEAQRRGSQRQEEQLRQRGHEPRDRHRGTPERGAREQLGDRRNAQYLAVAVDLIAARGRARLGNMAFTVLQEHARRCPS